MKIQTSIRTHESGSALIVTVITGAILGFSLASYLLLVANQNRSVMRSLTWNSAIPVVEAGVEEALTHLRYQPITDLGHNGWAADADGNFAKEARLDDSIYHVAIQPVEPPVIFALATVPAPLGQGHVQRRIRVRTTQDYLFTKAMVADLDIDLAGNNITTDSFDSTDSTKSTNRKYDPGLAQANGDVATNSKLIGALDIGNANIKGKVSTGPGGEIDIGPNGSVGSKTWVDAGNKGIEGTDYVNDDMNMDIKPAQAPFTAGPIAASGSVGGTNYTYVLPEGNFMLSTFTGTVRVTGDAVLYVTDSVAFSGKDFVMIDPGASLKLYVAAPTASIGGQGILNGNADALSFQYYGLPSNTKLALSGNASFTGVIYAPSAAFTLGGGGKDNYDFVGASVTRTVKMNGNFNFHYDESLANRGPSQGYIPISWDEMSIAMR
jgi:hypothetical protein